MEKRFVIAIILIFAVLFLAPQLFRRGRQTTAPPDRQGQEVEKRESRTERPEPVVPPQEILPQAPKETIITVQAPLYDVQLTTEGARAVSWKLKDYFKRSKKLGKDPVGASEKVDLIPLAARQCLAIEFDDFEIQDEMEGTRWTSSVEGQTVTVGDSRKSIEFTYKTSSGVIVSKKMTFFPDSYVVDVDIGFDNTSLVEAELGSYSLLWGKGIGKDGMLTDMEVAGDGPAVLLKTERGSQFMKIWKRTGFACAGKHVLLPEQSGPVSWVGFASKYFAAVLIPGPESWWSDVQRGGIRYAIEPRAEDIPLSDKALTPRDVWQKWGVNTTVGLVWPDVSIPAGENVSHMFRVYVGPKKWDILRSIQGRGDSAGKLGLGKMIHFGFFNPLGKGALWLLKEIYRVVNNYGVAIVCLTILIKILYFPLTQKSFKSMKKMQELQPQIAALKEQYRDDAQALQKKNLELYKQNHVHPMGGCLPMLLQIPVFIALYAVLHSAVEIRGAMFIPGWITDLSLPDTVARIAGFPINILPILMTGSMLAQQFVFGTGSSGSGQSNKMMAFMPIIFLFILYNRSSGLVLYWLSNNVLAMGHQYIIGRAKKSLFTLELEHEDYLKGGKISEDLRQVFRDNGIELSQNVIVSIEKRAREWQINDKVNKQIYSVRKENDKLNFYPPDMETEKQDEDKSKMTPSIRKKK